MATLRFKVARSVDRVVQLQRQDRDRFRFGRTVSFQGRPQGENGWCWHTAVGLVGPHWQGGQWLGDLVWKRRGPFVIFRFRGPVRRSPRFVTPHVVPDPPPGRVTPSRAVHRPEELARYAPSAVAAVEYVRGLPDDLLLGAARAWDGHRWSGEAYSRVLADLGPSTNPNWVTSECAVEAYERGLIEESELDQITD